MNSILDLPANKDGALGSNRSASEATNTARPEKITDPCYTSADMLKNFDTCPHCTAKGWPGVMIRIHFDTPKITRSDGSTFHLALFDGPFAPRAPSGGILANRLLADFRYVHDRFEGGVFVLLTNPENKQYTVEVQLEKAADQLAQILSNNTTPPERYEFDGYMLR